MPEGIIGVDPDVGAECRGRSLSVRLRRSGPSPPLPGRPGFIVGRLRHRRLMEGDEQPGKLRGGGGQPAPAAIGVCQPGPVGVAIDGTPEPVHVPRGSAADSARRAARGSAPAPAAGLDPRAPAASPSRGTFRIPRRGRAAGRPGAHRPPPSRPSRRPTTSKRRRPRAVGVRCPARPAGSTHGCHRDRSRHRRAGTRRGPATRRSRSRRRSRSSWAARSSRRTGSGVPTSRTAASASRRAGSVAAACVAASRVTHSAWKKSVPVGRCGPCCSVAPTGTIASARGAMAARSVRVSSAKRSEWPRRALGSSAPLVALSSAPPPPRFFGMSASLSPEISDPTIRPAPVPARCGPR